MHGDGPLWIIAFTIAAGGVAVLVSRYFSVEARARRAMKKVPKRAIAEVIQGEHVRIVGEVSVAEPIEAPLSGRPCAYWRVLVEQHVSRGKSSYWKTLVDEEEGTDFFLRDGTGKALVRTVHTKVVLEGDRSGGSGFLNDPSEVLEQFLSARGHDARGWFFNKRIRFREGAAEEGETVAAVGVGHWERDPDESARAGDGYREAQSPRRLVLSAPEDGTPLMLSDELDVTSA